MDNMDGQVAHSTPQDAQMDLRLTEEPVRYNVPSTPNPNPDVTQLVTVSLTANQIKAMTMYASAIGIDAFRNSQVLASINGGNPGAAMAYLMEDVKTNGRWSYNNYKSRLIEKNLFLS